MTEWLNSIVGETYAPYATIGIALIIVFILISFFFRILNAFRKGGFSGKYQNRLGITEAIALEGKRRIILVRRDNVEHLVMIGGENDLVIEQNIDRQPAPEKPTKKFLQKTEKVQETSKKQPAQQIKSSENKAETVPVTLSEPALNKQTKTVSNPEKPNDSAKITKEMDRLLDQIAGD